MPMQKHIRPGLRQAKILDLVVERGEVKVDALAVRFDTSSETIRRDLTVLADAGKIRKIHGGARSAVMLGEGDFSTRVRRNALAKRLIAEKIKALVNPGQTLFLDTGSTTLMCAEVLAGVKNLTIITNSTRIATIFAQGNGGAEVYMLGGAFRADNAQTGGETAIAQIATYRADMAIITVGAIDAGGAMDFSNLEAEVARAMMQASNEVTVVADHSKFSTTAPFHLCDLNGVNTVVTDRALDSEMMRACDAAQVAVI